MEPCQAGEVDLQGKSVPNYIVPNDQQLKRFLIVGTEGGTYYARNDKELTEKHATCINNLIREGQGEVVVKTAVEALKGGHAAKPNTALYTLAVCCGSEDRQVKLAAYKALCDACSIPTHLFMFVQFVENIGKQKTPNTTGWGRGLRKAVSVWYQQFAANPQRLAMLITKYRQRGGWTHRDLLRLCHAKPKDGALKFILRYAVKGLKSAHSKYLEDTTVDGDQQMMAVYEYLSVCDGVKQLKNNQNTEEVERVVALIKKHDLVREHIAPEMLSSVVVWQSLLEKMPLKALVRNLNKMTEIGLFKNAENVRMVVRELDNKEKIHQSRLHPYFILIGWLTYRSEKGYKGKLAWKAVPEVVTALENAFYAAFDNVTPTKKRILIALDVSTSMSWEAPKAIITPRYSSAAMMMVTNRIEPFCDVIAFSESPTSIDISKDMSLDQVIACIENIPMGATDCSLPMAWAKQNNKKYDAFVIYTDSETWFSKDTPANTLRDYREASGIKNAKLVTVAMTSDGFTISDPADTNMMDMVGFDCKAPTVLQEFIAGNLE